MCCYCRSHLTIPHTTHNKSRHKKSQNISCITHHQAYSSPSIADTNSSREKQYEFWMKCTNKMRSENIKEFVGSSTGYSKSTITITIIMLPLCTFMYLYTYTLTLSLSLSLTSKNWLIYSLFCFFFLFFFSQFRGNRQQNTSTNIFTNGIW